MSSHSRVDASFLPPRTSSSKLHPFLLCLLLPTQPPLRINTTWQILQATGNNHVLAIRRRLRRRRRCRQKEEEERRQSILGLRSRSALQRAHKRARKYTIDFLFCLRLSLRTNSLSCPRLHHTSLVYLFSDFVLNVNLQTSPHPASYLPSTTPYTPSTHPQGKGSALV